MVFDNNVVNESLDAFRIWFESLTENMSVDDANAVKDLIIEDLDAWLIS